MDCFSRLIVTAHIKNRNHGLCILYRMVLLLPQIRSLSLKKSLVKPVEKNICRNEAIIKLSELSSHLAYTRKLSARFARASTFLAPAKSFQRISHNPC